MSDFQQIHWHEGLFLRPHHLQTMQRNLLERIAGERKLDWSYPHGVVEAQLSADALESSRVQFDRLRVVMPSGLHVEIPESDDLSPLDIKKAFAASSGSLTVFLGVPLWSSTRSNSIEPQEDSDLRTKKIYRISEIQRNDENTGENPQPLLVRRVNAKLLLEDDDRTDLEVLPLLRIQRSTGEAAGGLPVEDSDYVPPCLLLSGSPRLFELVRDLANQVEAHRSSLLARLKPGFNMENVKGLTIRRILKQQTLNRFSARLGQLVLAPSVCPFTAYLELRDLLGELAALYPDREYPEVGDYDHDNLVLCFDELDKAIRPLLPEAATGAFKTVELVQGDRKLVAKLSADDLSKPLEYYLQITDGDDPRKIAETVTDAKSFKVMPDSMAFRAINGIELEEERSPPQELPTRAGVQYFRLLRSKNAMIWGKIKSDGALAIVSKKLEEAPMAITLYLTYAGEGN
ncbi:MAG: type VI secretion system baseplate subunit TssK [Planctomycetota bacterium]|nr:type VI secretion system baseplate subunit TssK [Planctomycetota bacterium]